MITETQLDTLEPKHLPENDEGSLTQIPNADRFSDESQPQDQQADQTPSKFQKRKSEVTELIRQSAANVSSETKEAVAERSEDLVNKTSGHLREVEESIET